MMPASHTLYLFLALPAHVREAAARCRDLPGLVADRMPDDRLHMTLGRFGSFAETPRAGIDWVEKRLSGAALPALRMYLDTLVSGRRSALLLPGEPPEAFGALQHAVLKRLGDDPGSWRRIRPHVTLGYGGPDAPTRAIDPIGWTADRLLLVESLVGEGRHVVHASWRLTIGARLAA
jgi:2'-5' RNA ligase